MSPDTDPRDTHHDSPLAAMDKLFSAEKFHRHESWTEANSIMFSLHRLEAYLGPTQLAPALAEITSIIATAPTTNPASTMTTEQEQALRDAGSFVEQMPPIKDRASTHTLLTYLDIVRTSLTTTQASERLRVSPGRIRQRAADRTLYAIRDTRLLFPTFQFTDHGELPGWAHIAPHIPEDTYPVAVVRFMTTPQPDLDRHKQQLSPVQWLTDGGDVDELAGLVDDTFTPAGM